jgi:hypothetical protein
MTRAVFCLGLLMLAPSALARAPQLRPGSSPPVPARLRQGESGRAGIIYADPEGDRPREVALVIQGGDTQRLPIDVKRVEQQYQQGKQFREGVLLEWTIGPLAPGRYRVHFEATTLDGSARYPTVDDLPLIVESLLTKWLLLGAGVALALGVVPGVVFMGARRAADPAGAARTSVSIGVVAAYLWFLWLFASIYPPAVFAIVGVAAAGLTVWLIRRRST